MIQNESDQSGNNRKTSSKVHDLSLHDIFIKGDEAVEKMDLRQARSRCKKRNKRRMDEQDRIYSLVMAESDLLNNKLAMLENMKHDNLQLSFRIMLRLLKRQ